MAHDFSTWTRARVIAACIALAVVLAGSVLLWRQLAGTAAKATAESHRPWRSGSDVPVPVRVASAVEEPLIVRQKALGTVTPLSVVTVRSRVDGELVRVAFREGQRVREGELLAQIDPRPFEVRLAQAQGQQAQNLAQLESARSDLQRYLDLKARGYIAAQQLSNQEALVRQYEARRKSDQAAVDDARLQLDYTRILAPISGRVGLRAMDAGNLVRASDAEGIATITRMQPISVLFTVPEPDLPAVRAAVRANPVLPVEAWDRDERTRLATGSLVSLDNQIDTATGTLRLRAQFNNEDEALFPNQFVNVRMQVSDAIAIVIPDAAVQFGAQGNYVYVVGGDDTVTMRAVELGASEGDRVAIAGGLAAGERVVLEGIDRLREGSRVEVIADAGQARE